MPLKLEIVTPERMAYRDEVDAVTLPGSEGELGVLPHHAPLITTLGAGELRVRKGDTVELFAVIGGFLQVRPDRVIVMAETADLASDIDLERAQAARREAERALESGYHEGADLSAARAALQVALLRIRVSPRQAGTRATSPPKAITAVATQIQATMGLTRTSRPTLREARSMFWIDT